MREGTVSALSVEASDDPGDVGYLSAVKDVIRETEVPPRYSPASPVPRPCRFGRSRDIIKQSGEACGQLRLAIAHGRVGVQEISIFRPPQLPSTSSYQLSLAFHWRRGWYPHPRYYYPGL